MNARESHTADSLIWVRNLLAAQTERLRISAPSSLIRLGASPIFAALAQIHPPPRTRVQSRGQTLTGTWTAAAMYSGSSQSASER